MNYSKRVGPIGKWIWDKIDKQDRHKVENKLLRGRHEIIDGNLKYFLDVISGELRGSIISKNPRFSVDESGIFIKLPEAIVISFKDKENLTFGNIISIPGLESIPVIGIDTKGDFPTHFIFR